MTERPDPNAAHAQTLRDLKADDPDFEPDRDKPDFGEAVRRARSRLGPDPDDDPVFDDGPDFYDDPGPAYWPRTPRRPRRSVWPGAILGITLVLLVALVAAAIMALFWVGVFVLMST